MTTQCTKSQGMVLKRQSTQTSMHEFVLNHTAHERFLPLLLAVKLVPGEAWTFAHKFIEIAVQLTTYHALNPIGVLIHRTLLQLRIGRHSRIFNASCTYSGEWSTTD